MMPRRVLLCALMVMTSALCPPALAAQVRGHVTDEKSGDPVAGALIWLTGRTFHMARSSTTGAYAFVDVPAGRYCVRVDSPGFDAPKLCIGVTASASMVVDLPLTMRPVAINPLVVRSARGVERQRGGTRGDSLQLTLLERQLSLPGSPANTLAAAQLGDLTHMPAPDQSAGRRPHALYLWGSSAERGRVLLDGASLSAPLHLGALLPPLDPDIIAAAELHGAGISPRYDGGTTYIMDYSTRSASDQPGTWGELDLLAGRIGAESPINGRGRAIVSARRVNDEVIDGLMSSRFGYGYADVLGRADMDLGDDSGVQLTVLGTREAVSIPRDLGDDRASWTNRAATLAWHRDRFNAVQSARFSVSRGVADLPLLSARGGHLSAGLDRYSGLVEQRWYSGALHWGAGAEVEHVAFRRRSRAIEDPFTGAPGPVQCTPSLPCSHAGTTLLSTFGELSIEPAPSMSLSLGARTMYDASANWLHVLPRAAMTILPAPHYAVTLAAGRFSQPYVRDTPLAAGTGHVDVPIDVDIAHATHVEVGVTRRSDRLHMRAGSFLRLHARAEPELDPRTVLGADLSLEYLTPAGIVSLSYSVSSRRATQQLATAAWHGTSGRWRLDLNGAYGTGLPLTSIVLEQPGEAEALWQPTGPVRIDLASDALGSDRDYTRVDALLGAEWQIDRGDRRSIRLMPYVRIINALSQRESLFYFQEGGDIGQPPRGLARLPAVPMIGLRWHF